MSQRLVYDIGDRGDRGDRSDLIVAREVFEQLETSARRTPLPWTEVIGVPRQGAPS